MRCTEFWKAVVMRVRSQDRQHGRETQETVDELAVTLNHPGEHKIPSMTGAADETQHFAYTAAFTWMFSLYVLLSNYVFSINM